MKLWKRLGVIVPLLAIALASGIYLTLDASAQGTTDTLTGCLEGGQLSNLAVGDQPLNDGGENATVVTLNQTGPQGPQGEPGPQGPQGEPGLTGSSAGFGSVPESVKAAIRSHAGDRGQKGNKRGNRQRRVK